ncbi:MAG: AsmA family protein [Caulobacteraceae bacterium]
MTAAESPLPRRPRPLFPRVGAVIGAALLLAIVVFLLVFQWNWLRGPIARIASGRLHRQVTITGNLDVRPWSWSPSATVHGLVIGNPPWAGKGPMATFPTLTLQVKILPLLTGKLVLPLVEADRPSVAFVRDASGRANWIFNPGQPPKPLPAIGHLIVQDGVMRFSDARRGFTFAGAMSSNEQAGGAERGTFVLSGRGLLNAVPFTAVVTGGPLIKVDRNRPYRFTAKLSAGPTSLAMVGALPHPFDLAQVSGRLHIVGPDASSLYHLTGLALPSTPPYDIAGGFARVQANYAFHKIHGRIGDSDIAGSLSVDDRTGRPFLTADLATRRLRLADLLAVTGAAPGKAAGHTLSPSQKIEGARLHAEHRIFPDSRLEVARVRGMDARMTYRAGTVVAGKLPIRALSFKLALDHGVLTVDPLELTLPQGRLAGMVRIDARKAIPTVGVDLRLTNAEISTLVTSRGPTPPIEGALFAHAKLSGVGVSVRAAAADAAGTFTVAMPHGEIRKALAELLGIDAARGIFLLITKNNGETPIRCAVAQFDARGGVLTARRIVFDTGVVLALGTGRIDLRDETFDLRLDGHPKKFRLIRINAPITLKGSLEGPKFSVDIVKAVPQALIATAIGALAAPLAAILPFVGPGLAKDVDCGRLMGEAAAAGVPAARR